MVRRWMVGGSTSYLVCPYDYSQGEHWVESERAIHRSMASATSARQLQGVKTDKDSGIVKDVNGWTVETIGNPRYPLEVFQRVVTQLETTRIVRGLPALVL